MPIKDWTPNAEIMLQYNLREYFGELLYTISDNGDPPAYTSVVGPSSWQEPFADLYAVLASRTLGLGSGTASDALAAQGDGWPICSVQLGHSASTPTPT
jgi:hypothetical protein